MSVCKMIIFKPADFIDLDNYEWYSQNKISIIGILVLWRDREKLLLHSVVSWMGQLKFLNLFVPEKNWRQSYTSGSTFLDDYVFAFIQSLSRLLPSVDQRQRSMWQTDYFATASSREINHILSCRIPSKISRCKISLVRAKLCVITIPLRIDESSFDHW